MITFEMFILRAVPRRIPAYSVHRLWIRENIAVFEVGEKLMKLMRNRWSTQFNGCELTGSDPIPPVRSDSADLFDRVPTPMQAVMGEETAERSTSA